ncbi:unnamed protein product, partial [Prorocentrum cordatum]
DGDEADDDEGEGEVAKPQEGENAVATKTETLADSGGCDEAGPVIPGWILRKQVHTPPAEPRWANDEFTPLRPAAGRAADPEASLAYPTFHQCADEFFAQLEEHRLVEQKAMHAQSAYAKVEKIRVDQGRRVEQLEGEQAAAERQAELIEANVELVTRVLDMLNTMVASQVDWGELWREVKRQQRLGHPIAQHIHSLDLQRNEVKLLLTAQAVDVEEDGEAGDDSEEEDRPMEVVPLDLNLSARANVSRLHSRRKETRDKTSRTLTQAEIAVKQAEKKAEKDLKKFELKQTIRRTRQTWWFEKFIWFISSENYPAKPFFIKNPSGGEVPPATLCEAGTTALCHSSAWDKHIVISPWWVTMDAVSRGAAPTGSDFVAVEGGFFVQGRRRFTPHLHLEMGITLLFHVGEASRARHRGERRSRYLEALGRAGAPAGEQAGAQSGASTEEAAEEGPAGAAEEAAEEEPAEAAEEEDAAAAGEPAGAAGQDAAAAEEPAERAGGAVAQGAARAEQAGGGGEEEAASRGGRSRISRAERRRIRPRRGREKYADQDEEDLGVSL